MFYLFYGDAFFTEQKLIHRKSEFSTKHGAQNIFSFDAKNWNTQDICQAIRGGGLFAEKKMIIIHGLPQDTGTKLNESTKEALNQFYDYFQANKSSIPSDTLLILTTSIPDKKTKWAKYFLDSKNSELKLIEHKADKKTMGEFIINVSNGLISADQADYIISVCNGNMHSAYNESKKAISYIQSGKHINNDILQHIIGSSAIVDVWSFLDSIIIDQDKKGSEKFINFAKQDNNEFQFLGLLYRSIGGIIHLIDCRDHGIYESGELMKASKLPPFTVSRYVNKKDKLISKKIQLQNTYHNLINMDYKLKMGVLPPEAFWSQVLDILQFNS